MEIGKWCVNELAESKTTIFESVHVGHIVNRAMQKLTLAELKSRLNSGDSLDFDIRWNQHLLDEREFWQLPFSIAQWKEMASQLSPYRFIESLLRIGKNAPEVVYGVTHELFPEVCKRLMPLYASRKHTSLLSWVKSESCLSDLSETLQRIAQLEDLLEKDLTQVMDELSQWKVDEVMFAICACADANIHSRKLWQGEWAPPYLFRSALIEIWNAWANLNSDLQGLEFHYLESGLPPWDMRVHGAFSFRFRHKDDYEHELKDLGRRLLELLERRFPMYLELQALRLKEMNEMEFAFEGPQGLHDLVVRSKLLSLADKKNFSDIYDEILWSHWMKECREWTPMYCWMLLEFEGFSEKMIRSLPWKGIFKLAATFHAINVGMRKPLEMGKEFNRIHQDFKKRGESWAGQLGIDQPMILARLNRDELISNLETWSELEGYVIKDLVQNMEGLDLRERSPSYPWLAHFASDPDQLYWPVGLFTHHSWCGYLQSLAIASEIAEARILGQWREQYVMDCITRMGFDAHRGLKSRLSSGKIVELDVLALEGNTAMIIEVKGFMNNPDLVQSIKKVSSALLDQALSTLMSVRAELLERGNQLDCFSKEGDGVTLKPEMKVYYLILTNIQDQFTEIAPGVILCSVSIFDLLSNRESLRTAISLAELEDKLTSTRFSLQRILSALENNREEWAFLVGTSGQLWHER